MVERITPDEAHRRVTEEGWIHVDVRSVPEFEAGHPAGAYNVPLLHAGPAGLEPNPRFVAVMRRRFGPEAKIVLGCRSGNRSLQAAQVLRAEGFAAVADQRAGWGGARGPFGNVTEPGWEQAGRPAATAPEPGRSWDDLEETP